MALRGLVRIVDILTIVAIPVILVLIHLLPNSVREALIMNYGSPSVPTAYTTHFVHADWSHFSK